MLNIMVTVLAWVVEMFGFLLVFIGTHIVGHQNHFVNLILQTLTNLIYFVLIPSFLLINDADLKGRFAESNWYDNFLTKINCHYVEQDKDKKEEEWCIDDVNSIIKAGVETNQDIEDHISIDNLARNESDDIEIDRHQPVVKGSGDQIDDTDTHKNNEDTHHPRCTNWPSNDCKLIDLEAVNRNSS